MEPLDQAVGAADEIVPGLGVEGVDLPGEADAAGHRVELGNAHPVGGEDEVRTHYYRQLRAGAVHAAEVDDPLRLAAVEVLVKPGRLQPPDALVIQQVAGFLELQEQGAEGLEELVLAAGEPERLRRDAPRQPAVGMQLRPVALEKPTAGGAFVDAQADRLE